MDVYGLSSPDLLRIDDLLDFSNDEIFSSSSTVISSAASSTSPSEDPFNFPSSASNSFHTSPPPPPLLTDFTHDLCVPSDDAAHLEWLSRIVDDSFSCYPADSLTMTVKPEMSFTGKPRSRRSRAPAPSVAGTWAPMPESELCYSVAIREPNQKFETESMTADGDGARRCTHCASEKTPQWRTGPIGPKTLCNACGVRFKSGRLVPEYRPASSPTFVLTRHSNSHRKVMELRRQKEQLDSAVQLPPFQPQ